MYQQPSVSLLNLRWNTFIRNLWFCVWRYYIRRFWNKVSNRPPGHPRGRLWRLVLTVPVVQHLPEGGREEDVRQAISIGEQPGDLLVGVVGGAASDAGDEERHFRMLVGELDELPYRSVDVSESDSIGGDGIAPSLQAAGLPVDGTELFQGKTGGTTAVVSGQIASEDEDLVFTELFNVVRSYTVQHLFLGEEVLFKVDGFASQLLKTDFLVVLPTAGAHLVKHDGGPFNRGLEVHGASDSHGACRLTGILVRTDVGEDPSLSGQGFHHLFDHVRGIMVRTVLESVGNDGDENMITFFHQLAESGDGKSHRIVKRSSAIGLVLFRCQVLDLFDLFRVDDGADKGPAGAGVEGDQRDHLVIVRILLLGGTDCLQGFIGTAERLRPNGVHGSAFIQDD